MSVRVDTLRDAQSNDTNPVTTPKKRKHDADSRESSKKKKKQRVELVESTSSASQSTPINEAKKSKKKRKETDKPPARDGAATETDELDHVNPIVEGPESTENITATADGTGDGIVTDTQVDEVIADLLNSVEPSSFYSTRISLYVSIPAISLETATSSILATHLAPLLLTYFPPANGIVLGFSDAVLSAKPDHSVNLPLIAPRSGDVPAEAEVLARTADEFGVCWTWLTVTLLVFRPERGDELYGWTNVTSEGFVGLVSYNYFQSAIGQNRIPKEWRWNGPTRDSARGKRKPRRGKLHDEDSGEHAPDDEVADEGAQPEGRSQPAGTEDTGFFADASGAKIPATLLYRVVDTEIVPAHDRHKLSLQIDGTLLDKEAEQKALEEDKLKFERTQRTGNRSQTPGGDAFMTGARV